MEWAHVPGPEMKLFMSFSLSPLAKYTPGISEHSGEVFIGLNFSPIELSTCSGFYFTQVEDVFVIHLDNDVPP